MDMDKTESRTHTAVQLGGKEYGIRPLNIRQSREWRQKFADPFQVIIGVLQQANNIELSSAADIGTVISQVGGILLGSMDLVIDALFAYSPELQADEETIMDNATDEEAVAALWEVLKLAYPFGLIVQTVSGGLSTRGQSKSLPVRNGTPTRRK